uniref:T9SS type A sorting domain-containing protein n=1 Tax=Aestuariivivens sediminis TaxID=2913557 RepID=UPI001F5A4B49
DACGGNSTVTWNATSDCEDPIPGSATFTVTAAPAVSLTCPGDSTEASCQTQGAIDSAFATWLASVSYSGGCGAQISNNNTGAPDACGGSTTVRFTVSSDCEEDVWCEATFTVTDAPDVNVVPITDDGIAACNDQGTVDVAYNAWFSGLSITGGCGLNPNIVNPGPPDACGGNSTVTWNATSDCEGPIPGSATFTVTAAPAVSLTCPGDSTEASCQTQGAIDSAFATWLASVSYSGGCGAQISNNNTGAPDACGGSTTVRFTVSSDCEEDVWCEATFTVTDAPDVNVVPITDDGIAACNDQGTVDAAYNAWFSGLSITGGCGLNPNIVNPGPPDACGGSSTVTWNATSDCEGPIPGSATFTVTAAPAVNVVPITDDGIAACNDQGTVDAAYNAWFSGLSITGGCGLNPNIVNPGPPDACGGSSTVTWNATSDCEDPIPGSATFTVTAAPAVNVVPITDDGIAACNDQGTVDAAYNAWFSGLSITGGCGLNPNIVNPGPPDACGGNSTVTWNATSDCEDPIPGSATFTVTAAPAVSLTCPGDYTVDSCMTQAAIDADFANWLASVSYSGGCGAQISNNNTGAPDACGGSTTVRFTVSSDCEEDVWCEATYTVNEIPPSCEASVLNDLQCEGVDINLQVVGSGCRTPFTYTWSGAAAGYLDDVNSDTPVLSGAPVGTHDFTVTVVDADGCESTCNVSATVYDCTPNCGTAFGVETSGPDGNGLYSVNTDVSSCFRNDGFKRWGWVNEITTEGTYEFELFRGAGRCDLSKGTHVGSVTLYYGEGLAGAGEVVVKYDLLGDGGNYVISEAHIWIGCDPYPTTNNGEYTVAPGQYNYNSGDIGFSENTLTTPPIEASGKFYFIAHAVVCDYDVPEGSEIPGLMNTYTFDQPNEAFVYPDCDVDTGGWGKLEDKKVSFTAYPVPFQNEVNIGYKFEYDTDVKIDVYDIKGALIRQAENTSYIKGTYDRTNIDLSGNDDQMYFVRLTTREGTLVKKIVSSTEQQ